MQPESAAESNKRKIPNYLIGIIILFLILLIASFFWIKKITSPRQIGQLEHVKIANTEYAGTCSVIAARDKGYFEQQGLLISIVPYTTGKAALEAVINGQADLATSADLPIMFAALKKQPISVIATIFITDKDYGVVGRRDKGVVSPDSLKGKQIGVTLTTSGHFALDAFLNRQRLSTSDVKLRDLKPEQLIDALVKGEVDAALAWEPYLGILKEKLSGNATSFSMEEVYDSIYNISSTRSYVNEHPETIKKILHALIQGGRFCKENPDAASEVVAKTIRADANKLKTLWPSYHFNITLDQGLVLALEDETRWAIKNKLTNGESMPNYLNYIYINGLQSVDPNAVTIIH